MKVLNIIVGATFFPKEKKTCVREVVEELRVCQVMESPAR